MLPRGYLIIIKHDGRDGSVYPVTTSACTVGRGLHNDVRFRVQSVSNDQCVIYTSEFQPALLRNLSNSNPTEVNNVPVRERERGLEHGDVITIGERSFRWEYHPQSRYYVPSKVKDTGLLSSSPLPGSTGMVGVPVSVLQSTLGTQPFSRQSVVMTERKVKLSPELVAANRQSAAGDLSFSPSKLVAVVSPQRRPQSEKKTVEAASVSSPAATSVIASRNQSSATSADVTSSNRKSSRLYSKSARKSTMSEDAVKTLQQKRSLQALVTTRKTRRSVGTPKHSRIPRFVYNIKYFGSGMPQSSTKHSTTSGMFTSRAATSSVRKTKSEQKLPLPARSEVRKRTHESGLRSAARAAKKLKLESPKTPDKKKMAALLVCHGKASRAKTPQLVSSVPREVSGTSAVKSTRKSMEASSSHRVSVQKSARKKYDNVRTSVGDETPSSKQAYSMEIPAYFNLSSGTEDLNVVFGEQHQVKDRSMRFSQNNRRSSSLKTEQAVSPGLQEAKLKITVSSAEKTPKRDMRKSQFRQLKNESLQSASAFSIEKDAGISEPPPSSPHMHRRCRSMTALKEQGPQSHVYHTYLISPSSQNTTFDFDSVETPSVTLERLVSPLTSNRKRKSLRWQDESTSKGNRKSEPVFKKRGISERISGDVTSLGSSSLHSLPPHFCTSLIDESVDTSHPEGKEQVSYNNSFSVRVETRSSYQSAPPKFHGIQKDMQKVSRISRTPKLGLTNVSGRRQLMKTSSSAKSVSDTPFAHGSMKLVTTPSTQKLKTDSIDRTKLVKDQKGHKSLKNLSGIFCVMQLRKTPSNLQSPRKSLIDISGVKRLMQTPNSPNSPKNDLRDVRASRQLMMTPKSPKSPKNLLRDTYGGRRLTTTPKSLQSPNNDLKDGSGVRKMKMTAKSSESPKNDLRDIRGVRKLKTTPKSPKSPKNDVRDVRGVKRLVTTPKSPKSPKNDVRDVRGVKRLVTTPKSPKSPKNDLRDVRGVKRFLTTPKSPKSPKNDLRDVRGVKRLMTTPKSPKSPNNDLRDVRGVKRLMTTPKSPKSPKNDLRDVRGVKRLMTTPKSPKSPKNDLRDVRGVKRLMTTPKSPKSPKNDLRDVRGVKRLMTTPKSPKSPKNDLRDVRGVKRLMTTPKSPKSPKNDLNDVRGVKRLMTTPKIPKSPKNDLSDVRGVKRLMTTPKSPKSPKNDLSDVRGVKRLMTTPKSPKSPKNDLSDVRGVRKLMTTPKIPKSPKNDLTDVDGVKRLMKTPESQKSPKKHLKNVHGVKTFMASPKGIKSPVTDLTDVDDVRRLTPQVKKPLENDLTDVVGGKGHMKTSSPSPSSKVLTDTNDIHVHGNASLPPQSPVFGGHSSLAESTHKSPQRSIRQDSLPSVVTGTRSTRHGTTFVTKVPEADIGTEMYVDQKTVPMSKDIKRSNTRSMRSRKEPNLGILQAADISPKPHVKKPRRRKNEKTGSTEDLSPGRNLKISPGHIVTSDATKQVHWNNPKGDKVTRRKNIASNAEVEPPSRNRKTAKSKISIETEESAAQKDTDHLKVSFPSVRTRRGRQLTSASQLSLSPTQRKQGAGVSADAEVSSLPKQKQGSTATAKVKSPVHSKRQQRNTAKVSVEELSDRKRRGGTASTGLEYTSSPKSLHVPVTEDTGETASSATLTSRRRRGATVVTEVETLQLPVTKKTRGKLAVRSAVVPTASAMPSEDIFSASDKEPAEINSPSPPGKRRRRGIKPVEPSSPGSARKLRGTKSSVLGEEEQVSSNTRTRNKPRVRSSPVSKAKSPRAVSRRGGRKTAQREVSPQVTTGRQTRAASRRKK